MYGYQQSDVFPGPGPDFSYIKLEKAYVFNSEDDSFFVQEIKSEGEDIAFQNFMQSTFPWSTDFRLKLLDYDQENNLKTAVRITDEGKVDFFGQTADAVTSLARAFDIPLGGRKATDTATVEYLLESIDAQKAPKILGEAG